MQYMRCSLSSYHYLCYIDIWISSHHKFTHSYQINVWGMRVWSLNFPCNVWISTVSIDVVAALLYPVLSWCRHQMETFSASLALCAGNSQVAVFSIYPCPLWWLREYIYFVLYIIIKSEVWTITHCLGLDNETMLYAVCLSVLFCIMSDDELINANIKIIAYASYLIHF